MVALLSRTQCVLIEIWVWIINHIRYTMWAVTTYRCLITHLTTFWIDSFGVIEWMRNYTTCIFVDVITHPCHILNTGFAGLRSSTKYWPFCSGNFPKVIVCDVATILILGKMRLTSVYCTKRDGDFITWRGHNMRRCPYYLHFAREINRSPIDAELWGFLCC